MKMKNLKQERPQKLKRKLMSALAMLLISTILMSSTTFAWFVLSTAPEVTGIETTVGANGSLEIVLLNKDTRADMSTIRAGLGGGSLQENKITANNVWGNLVDLSYAAYGLGELVLMPARLDASANGQSYSVDVNKLLAVPTYGYDGRIIELTNNTASAIYQDTDFMYSGAQNYGVRAIGTSNALSPQGTALSSAKNNIAAWTQSAKAGARSALTKNMEGLFAIIIEHTGSDAFTNEHKATLDSMLTDLKTVLGYIDSSLRQGLVAYVASEIGDEALFTAARDRILAAVNLKDVIAEAEGVPTEFTQWVDKLAIMQNNHSAAVSASEKMTDGEYDWDEIKAVMANILNMDQLLINGKTIASLDVTGLMNAAMIEMTLSPGSGLFADIADFSGNYVVASKYAGKDVEMTTASAVNPAHLVVLSNGVNTLTPADGGDEATALPLTATYGYAIDLAFRCNAAMPDLVLQTKGVQRVYNGGENEGDILSESGNTQGGGSYMEFSSKAADFNLEQQLALMDAIRVGFVDDQGTILGIAKLNVTSREVTDDVVKAPLYMYDYAFEADDVSDGLILTMGERKLTDNLITKLEQNVAKAVTVVVWLDGDLVDNTMVAATAATSLDGVLNLQFATSAELVPAQDGNVLNYTFDKSGLEALLNSYDILNENGEPELDENGEPKRFVGAIELATEGQGTYTNVSWNAFMGAYNRAEAINADANASHIAIRNAVEKLAAAMKGLEEVSVEALTNKTQELRTEMGTDETKIGAYVIDKGVDGYVAVTSYTQAELDKWNQDGSDKKGEIKSVNHDKNRNDEGNGVYTAKYTDATWNALATALYQAEAVAMNAEASDDQINAALTALVEAEEALAFAVFYVPYEYNGDLYYMAKCEAEAEDTYGRWYDSNFKRIVADVTILKLDAYAKKATIAEIGAHNLTVPYEGDEQWFHPGIGLLKAVFPELQDVNVKGVHWNEIDTEIFTELMTSAQYNRLKNLVAVLDSEDFTGVDTSSANTAKAAAQDLINQYEQNQGAYDVTKGAAAAAITNLNDAIVELYETVAKADESPMSDNLKLMLTAAVNAAKADPEYDTKADLKAKTEAAEALLVEGATATNKQASDALADLNALIDPDITEDNTIVHKLSGFDSNEFVYSADSDIALKLTGKSGTTTLSATILTEDGVVISVSKEIKVCNWPEVTDKTTGEGGVVVKNGDEVITTLNMKKDENVNLNAVLNYAEGVKDQETVISYTWSSDTMAVATVSGSTTATVAAVAAGTAKITVSVKTDCGSTYWTTIVVNVTE